MLSTLANDKYKVLASAQITITDQTDAANLAGNISVINSTKNQIYLLGSSDPFVPNWGTQPLVLKPFIVASSVFLNGTNPDLFNPFIYPDLNTPTGNNDAYIKNIQWYKIDQAGNKTAISEDETFSHEWTYQGDSPVTITDKRQLVISKNFLNRNDTATILCNFSFNDPYAGISVPVSYSIDITCISTGSGATRAVINPIDGTSFYNDNPKSLNLISGYYKDGVEQDLQKMIETSGSASNVKWAIRSGVEMGGWKILDPASQDDDIDLPQNERCYEIHRFVTDMDGSIITGPDGKPKTEKTTNAKGGVILKIFRGLIAGSDVIKVTVEDSEVAGSANAAMEVIYDFSDPTRVTIDSSNGDKLVGGITGADRTEFKAVVTHEGVLLEEDASEYNTDFDYYWFRTNLDASKMDNMYLDEGGNIQFKNVSEADYTQEEGWPKKGARKMRINREHIDRKNTFMLDLTDKRLLRRRKNRLRAMENLLTEEEFSKAKLINVRSGVLPHDIESHYVTAFEMKAQQKAIQEKLVEAFLESCKNKTDK